MQVPVSVDANGEKVLQINYRRLAVTRGLRFSRSAPKGGKHTVQVGYCHSIL